MPFKTTNLNRPMGAAALRNVERQRQMAAALQGQALQPLRGQMAGRVYVAPSPMQGVAKLGQMLAGTYAQNKADEREAQIQADQRQAFTTDMQAYQDAIKGTPMVPGRPEVHATPPSGDPFSPDTNPYQPATEYQPAIEEQAAIPGMDRGQAAMQHLINSQNPMAKKMGMSIYEKSLETPKNQVLGTGDILLGPNNEVLASNPKPETPEKSEKLGPAGRPLSVGDEAIDKEFSKGYVAWKTHEFSDAEKGITQLNAAVKDLKKDPSLTGPGTSLIPNVIRAKTNPKSLDTEEKVTEIVQRNLRLILGAQFTEKEGVRLIARAYNIDLDTSINANRVSRLVRQISLAAQAKQEATEYFDKYGTLQGWKGKLYTKADFDPDVLYPEDNNDEEDTGAPGGATGSWGDEADWGDD